MSKPLFGQAMGEAWGKDSATIGEYTAQVLRYDKDWIVKCEKLWKHDATRLVLAVVNVAEKDMHELLPPSKPEWVEVRGTYETKGGRERTVKHRAKPF